MRPHPRPSPNSGRGEQAFSYDEDEVPSWRLMNNAVVLLTSSLHHLITPSVVREELAEDGVGQEQAGMGETENVVLQEEHSLGTKAGDLGRKMVERLYAEAVPDTLQ